MSKLDIRCDGEIKDEDLILTIKIPRFYLDDGFKNKFLQFKTLFKFDDEDIRFCAPMVIDNHVIYPWK